ncbi:MAG TPA: hypothetical protein PKE39_02525 [Ignavibacteria bacterium]|nr:hypothetical protein [Ignavibacteria bacterium]HMQ97875.1 hypothetical protein [Ignavibacteria bacterium]
MDESVKKTSLVSKALIWFLVLSTIVVIYMTVKLLIASASFRDM